MPDFSIEKQFTDPVIGLDEVGRGPLAGPVISCGSLFNDYKIKKDYERLIIDSKKLSIKKREESFKYLQLLKKENIINYYIGSASVEEIDRLNILEATEQMRKYKIPASIILAQGLVESGAGASNLALKSNNHFGIKCHQEWRGKKVYHDDDKKNECFRKYKNPIESYKDHSEFLTTRGRYSFLFRLPIKDYVGWSKGLSKAGYATDPKYPEKLISVIERYSLWRYDGSKKQSSKNKKEKKKKVKDDANYTVKKGDTLYSLSKKYNISIDEIKKNNNLKNNQLSIGQKLKI